MEPRGKKRKCNPEEEERFNKKLQEQTVKEMSLQIRELQRDYQLGKKSDPKKLDLVKKCQK